MFIHYGLCGERKTVVHNHRVRINVNIMSHVKVSSYNIFNCIKFSWFEGKFEDAKLYGRKFISIKKIPT
jgi:hypothetical protein